MEKTRHLFNNFHRGINLEAPKENVRFGAIVQLVPMEMNICNFSTSEIHPALSVIINEQVVRYSQSLNDQCELTLAPSMKPCVRNSFRIISGDDKNRENELLKYGQQFRLECVENTDDPLYLYAAPKAYNLQPIISSTYDSKKFGEINLPLGLCFKSVSPIKTINL